MAILTTAQRQRFNDEGYLLIEEVLDPAEHLQPVLDEYNQVLEGIARDLLRQGVIQSTHADRSFPERLLALCVESGRNFPQYFDFSLPQKDIRRDTPIHVGPAVFRTLTNPRLLDLVEELIGPEIASNPVQHIRMKLPPRAVPADLNGNGLVSKVPWHQDNGVILPEADEGSILTVWLPVTPATIENGCLQVVPGSHLRGIKDHCVTAGGLTIPERLFAARDAVPIPMRPGSVLLMTQRTVHSSLDNVTNDSVRISMDLRYQPIGQPSGRPAFDRAGFVARSTARPETVLRDPQAWADRWFEVREHLAGTTPEFNRWKAGSDACA